MKLLFKSLLMIVMMTDFSVSISGQPNNKQRLTREQLAKTQANHIASKISMDDATTNKFVDTYCRCQKEIWALGPKMNKKGNQQQVKKTDAEAEKEIENQFKRSQKILDIRQKYYGEYSKFLSQQQIQQVYKQEKQMMKRMANHRKGKRNDHNKRN